MKWILPCFLIAMTAMSCSTYKNAKKSMFGRDYKMSLTEDSNNVAGAWVIVDQESKLSGFEGDVSRRLFDYTQGDDAIYLAELERNDGSWEIVEEKDSKMPDYLAQELAQAGDAFVLHIKVEDAKEVPHTPSIAIVARYNDGTLRSTTIPFSDHIAKKGVTQNQLFNVTDSGIVGGEGK